MTVIDVGTGEIVDRRPALAAPDAPVTPMLVGNQCRSIEVWADRCEDIDELRDTANKLDLLGQYLARTSNQGRAAIAAARLRIETRIGVLLGAAKVGRPETSPASDIPNSADLSRNQRHQFRKLADHPEIVEDVINDSDDEDPASRRKVLDEINRAKHAAPTDDDVREQERQAGIAAKARQLARFTDAFPLFIGMASNPDRAEILAAMPERKRLALLDIERGMS